MLLANLAILALAGFVGFAVISKVPNTLHTPLMSGTNAIHGIVLSNTNDERLHKPPWPLRRALCEASIPSAIRPPWPSG